MSDRDPAPTAPDDAPARLGAGGLHGIPGLVVLATRSRAQARDAALVLRAAGVPHELVGGGHGWQLVVPAAHGARAQEELADYAEENAAWPPPRPPFVPLSSGRAGAATYGALLVLLYPVGQVGLAGLNWWTAGRMDSSRVRAGEWERLFTALTLHVDLAHLAGNLAFGTLFGALASHTLGGGLAWLLAVWTGALGNLINIAFAGPDHRSVGASTAVFALLGVQAAYEWMRRAELPFAALRRVAPLLGALVLLGYLGMGDESGGAGSVDIGAHVFGFGAGVLGGLLAGALELPGRLGARGQRACASLAVLSLALAWTFALARS
jgi:rhomboid protease GluP